MIVRKVDKLMIAGISAQTCNEVELDSEKPSVIQQLWDDYADTNVYGKTFDKSKSNAMYGVYSDYESDVNGKYRVTIGVEVTKPKNAIVIEDQRYLVFSKKGELPDIVQELWIEIWEYFADEPAYERAYGIDFEKYAKEDEIEIYVSIK